MPKHWPHEYFFYILLVVNLIAAGALLVLEVLLRPRRPRSVLIVLLCSAFVLVLLQIATGYYFAFDYGELAAHIFAVLGYVTLMVIVVSGKSMAWHLNRIVGLFGLGLPMLVSPGTVILILLIAFGFENSNPSFQGRVSPSLSYRVAVNSFIGGPFYRYTLFRNPRWLPLVQKQIAAGTISSCEVPALDVSLKSGTQSGFVHIACQQTADTVLTGEIPLDDRRGYIILTARK